MLLSQEADERLFDELLASPTPRTIFCPGGLLARPETSQKQGEIR
jgi:hypothetical protein